MKVIETLSPTLVEAKGGGNLSLQSPGVVLYAGNSKRRMALLKHAFQAQAPTGVIVGQEPDVDVSQVARHKIDVVYDLGVPKDACSAIIAADTHTVTPIFNSMSGEIEMLSRGKPKNAQDVQEALQQMTKVADMKNEKPFYYADAASAMLHLNGSAHLVEDRERCLVELDREKLRWLGEGGFPDYVKKFIEFYSRPPYSTHNMEVNITDLSGGISLPLLVQMGAVTSVDGVDRGDERFRKALLRGIYTAAIGISPDILTTVQVDGHKIIQDWSWLNGVVDSALNG